jgi:hypothetical protein
LLYMYRCHTRGFGDVQQHQPKPPHAGVGGGEKAY